MKNLLYAFILACFPFALMAQYKIEDIPKELTKDADVVIRDSKTKWKISSPKEASVYIRKVVSFLNEDAARHAHIFIPYDDFTKINDIKIRLYDADGEAVKIKSKYLQDISLSQGSFEIDDTRAKVLDLADLEYPFSYEIEYEIKHKGLFSISSWNPVYSYNISVEKASISLQSKKGYKFKYKEENLKGAKKETSEDDVLSWSIKDFPAIEKEPYASDLKNFVPYLKMAPLDFELDGYAGSMRSWEDFGKWYNRLLNDVKELPDDMKDEVRSLVKEGMTDVEKIKTIYQYLQDNTRYVSIQLGIGGYKPLEPDFVHEKKYGDCKALSYYTKEMLDAVGIPSNMVLVQTGSGAREVDVDFPSNQFNHVFLCVPNKKDTIWLECTSQTVPFGYLGYHTSDRNVLLIDATGGKMIRTPQYGKKENMIVSNTKMDLDISGAATGEIKQNFNGLEYDRSGISYFLDKSDEYQKDWIKDYYDISEFVLADYELSKDNLAKNALGKLNSKIECRKFASTVGKRMFFKPIIVNKWNAKKLKNPEDRKTDFTVDETFTHKGTYEFKIPTDFKIEKNIKEIALDNKFGSYHLKVKAAENGTLIIERNLELNNGDYPAAEYADFLSFLNKIKKSDNQKVALVMTKEP